jgi:hypothetical protein
LNKKSAQKQKRPETTASRKPLFHEKPNEHSKTAKTKPKTTRLQTAGGSLLLGQHIRL